MYSNLYFAIVGCWCVDLCSLRNFGRGFMFVFNLLTGKVQLRAAPLAGQVPPWESPKIKAGETGSKARSHSSAEWVSTKTAMKWSYEGKSRKGSTDPPSLLRL